METMRARELAVAGAFEFTPRTFPDRRGLFVSPMQEEPFVAAVGARLTVAQTNHSVSARGVLRGIHFTATPPGQAKYVYCAHGHARDVVVDLRIGSPTFGRCDYVELDSRAFRAIYLPVGTGHAFLALEDDTVMAYMISTPYRPEFERTIDALDPDLALPWPDGIDFIRSERDLEAPKFADARELLSRYEDCL